MHTFKWWVNLRSHTREIWKCLYQSKNEKRDSGSFLVMYYFLLWNLPKERHESLLRKRWVVTVCQMKLTGTPRTPAATPTACCPGSWQLLKSNLEGEVVTSQGSAGKRRVGPGPFTVRVGVTVWLGFSDQLSIRITETKEHKIRITEQTQKECQGLKTEIMVRNLDYDNAFLK